MVTLLSPLERDILITNHDIENVILKYKKTEKAKLFDEFYLEIIDNFPSFQKIFDRIKENERNVYLVDELTVNLEDIKYKMIGPIGSSFFFDTKIFKFTNTLLSNIDLLEEEINSYRIKQDSFYIHIAKNLLDRTQDDKELKELLNDSDYINNTVMSFFNQVSTYEDFITNQLVTEKYLSNFTSHLLITFKRLNYNSGLEKYSDIIAPKKDFENYAKSFFEYKSNQINNK
jgi:hypothetical protein